jgi:hypothetical protein
MKHETLHYIFQYAHGRDYKEAAESLTYLCSMLWLCRSDKLNSMNIPFLVDITNSVIEKEEELQSLEKLPEDDEKAFRLGHNDVYFKDFSHAIIKRIVQEELESILKPAEEQVEENSIAKIKNFFYHRILKK